MPKKIRYEENPWAEDPPGRLVRVKDDFLPSPEVIKKAKVRILKSKADTKEFSLPLSASEIKKLHQKAHKVGLTAEGLIIGVLRDYVEGKLVLRD